MKPVKYFLIAALLPVSLWAGTVTGKVVRASDSTAIVGATVVLSGGGNTRAKATDSSGNFNFDSVQAANGYSIGVFGGGYVNASVGNIVVDSSSAVNLNTIYLVRNIGKVTGSIRRMDSTAKVLAGAKIAFYLNNLLVDSVFSDSTGSYLDSLSPGTYIAKTTLANFRSPSGAVSLDTTVIVTLNHTSTLNLYLTPAAKIKSAIIGRVLYAKDSTPVVGVYVNLGGDKLDDGWQIKTTDSNGYYRFDNVEPSSGRNVAVTAPGYAGSSMSGITVDSNTVVTLPTFYLVRNLGTLAGAIRRADSTTKILKGAKLMFMVNGFNVDSTVSDSNGNYSISLNAASYLVKASLAGYRSYKGTTALDTSAIVNFSQTMTLNLYLTPATGTIKGTISYPGSLCGGPITNARVYLERRRAAAAGFNNWILTDSTTSDGLGFYQFTGLIPATGGNGNPPPLGASYDSPNGEYRILVNSHSYYANYDTANILTSPYPTQIFNLAYAKNSETTANIILNGIVLAKSAMGACSAIHSIDPSLLKPADEPRIIDVYDLNGKFRRRMIIPVGESKANLPQGVAEESLFLTK